MNILGITGLGVDPAACLLRDGKIIAMAEEERFNRIKGSYGLLPEQAAGFCLEFANLGLDEIDYIVFPWDAYRYRFYMPCFFLLTYLMRSPKFQIDLHADAALEELSKYRPKNIRSSISFMLRKLAVKGKIPPIEFIPHHLAHAANAFYCSGFEKAHILVIDGSGEDKCTTIFKGEGTSIQEKKCFKIPDSLGWFYQSMTEFLGFLPNRQEGKTMALAAYGRNNPEIAKKFAKMISFDGKGNYNYNAAYSFLGKHRKGKVYSEKLARLFKDFQLNADAFSQGQKDVAFIAQDILEKIAVSIVKEIAGYTDYNGKLCIAGGVALNCKMNGVIASLDEVKDIFIPPTANDAGSALGAALLFSQKKGFCSKSRQEHAYLGPGFSNTEIEELLVKSKAKFKKVENIEATAAGLLAKDKIIGWFQGRMETGPRALGARSILASPLKNWMKDKVNLVKGRENWRPFSPSILYELKEEYLLKPKDSFFMTIAFDVSDIIKQKIPSAAHTDNTVRAHLVKKQNNPRFWSLINEFAKITGIPALLNTSFNLQKEPIVCSPQDALKTFYACELDFLAMGDFLITKNQAI